MKLAILLFAATIGYAQGLLVSAETLQTRLKNKDLVLIHSGTKQDYEAGHIPGAILVTLADISITGPNNLRLELPPADRLRENLMRFGVSDSSQIVIYAGNESIQSATRIFFTLDYLSLKASMLDGGLAAWKAKGLPVTAEPATPRSSTALTVKARPELVVDAAWLKDNLNNPGFAVIDARTPEFYTGASAGQMPRAGHIPGAVNVPFPTLLTDAKTFHPPAVLAERLGAKPGVVTYCHIGQQATVAYFAARLAGKQAKLYDGSFQDWSQRSELPVAK